ncbi:hypothetical protein F5Y13DRAFT_143154 [Hypoxylon sp. FL1857]|nr:hypothetical protein F5Y13DRAFT_143154 [Hypoxylon sp. FL1857]
MQNLFKKYYLCCSELCPQAHEDGERTPETPTTASHLKFSNNAIRHIAKSLNDADMAQNNPESIHDRQLNSNAQHTEARAKCQNKADNRSGFPKIEYSEIESSDDVVLVRALVEKPSITSPMHRSKLPTKVDQNSEDGLVDHPTLCNSTETESDIASTMPQAESEDEHSGYSTPPAEAEGGSKDAVRGLKSSDSIPKHNIVKSNHQCRIPPSTYINPHALQKEVKAPHYSSRTQRALTTTSSTAGLLEVQVPVSQQIPLNTNMATTEQHGMTIASAQTAFPMVTQSFRDFARDSLEQVEQFKLPAEKENTYREIFAMLKRAHPDEVKWSDGSQWKALAEAGYQERQRGSIRYALTAIAFSRWHQDQVQFLHHPPQIAAREISKRIIGVTPEGDSEKAAWERRRKGLTTHLTRGRKWARLVKDLGFGILFKNAWILAKSTESSLAELVSHPTGDSAKMCVLRLLEKQMDMLLEEGRTQPALLRQALEDHDMLSALPPHTPMSDEITRLQEEMRHSTPNSTLSVRGTNLRFDIDILSQLHDTEWFSEELIMLCLFLTDKSPHVRVGFSIPIHKQNRVREMMPQPFERAALQIKEWNDLDSQYEHTCFFPLFQYGNHFSLLEINQREGFIYHYDSQRKGPRKDLKKACKYQFPAMRYADEMAPRQLDTFSCGPLVVAFAQLRMVGRSLTGREVDADYAMELRMDALNLIKRAWRSGVISSVEQIPGQKRRRNEPDERQEKRLKLRDQMNL